MIPWLPSLFWGSLVVVAVGFASFLYGRSLHTTVVEQDVSTREVVNQVCPNRQDVEIYSHVAPDKADDDTREFMRLCGYQYTGTPFYPKR